MFWRIKETQRFKFGCKPAYPVQPGATESCLCRGSVTNPRSATWFNLVRPVCQEAQTSLKPPHPVQPVQADVHLFHTTVETHCSCPPHTPWTSEAAFCIRPFGKGRHLTMHQSSRETEGHRNACYKGGRGANGGAKGLLLSLFRLVIQSTLCSTCVGGSGFTFYVLRFSAAWRPHPPVHPLAPAGVESALAIGVWPRARLIPSPLVWPRASANPLCVARRGVEEAGARLIPSTSDNGCEPG